MPKVDLSVGVNFFNELEVPDDCTIGHWKQLLSQGFLGDKILYATKLTCREEGSERGRTLEDTALVTMKPGRMRVEGPHSVVQMLELALKKKLTPRPVVPPTRPNAPTSGQGARQPPAEPTPLPERRPSFPGADTTSAPERALVTWESLPFNSSGEDKRLQFVCSGLQGMRPYMEDRSLALLSLPGYEHTSLFGIFDGHGGDAVAEHSARALPRIVAGALKDGLEPAEALTQSFRLLDEELWGMHQQTSPHPYNSVGSTAVVTLMLHEEGGHMRLFCANCGDSRAVLCRHGKAVDLSVDQKPQNTEEKARIQAAGGRVQLFGPCWRIDGGLNLSRALGDFAYKASWNLPAEQQKVISVPEVTEVAIEKDDEFVVMGSDGVFDVTRSEALVLLLREAHNQQGQSWEEAVALALRKALPSGDNVSICLVVIRGE